MTRGGDAGPGHLGRRGGGESFIGEKKGEGSLNCFSFRQKKGGKAAVRSQEKEGAPVTKLERGRSREDVGPGTSEKKEKSPGGFEGKKKPRTARIAGGKKPYVRHVSRGGGKGYLLLPVPWARSGGEKGKARVGGRRVLLQGGKGARLF